MAGKIKWLALIILTALVSVLIAQDAQQAPQPPQPLAVVSPDANKLLQQIADAYTHLHGLRLTGSMQLTGDIDGRQISQRGEFTAVFAGPARFRHHFNDDATIGGDGQKLSVYIPAENIYSTSSIPAGAHLSDFPDPIQELLRTQDLSLALALSNDPKQELLAGATDVKLAPDVTIDGQACPALAIALATDDLTVAVDPSTHLLRQVASDQSRGLRKRGADVKVALVTLDFAYAPGNSDIRPDELTIDIPPTAQEIPLQGGNAADLEGKPAPDFRLLNLDGGEVSNHKLKGDVYVLDFWATWCVPCQMSLPELDKIYQEHARDGLKAFAVNGGEDPGTVRQFVAKTGLTIPILLDSEGTVSAAFGADAIPETVIVGRDGKIQKVFIGIGNEQAIEDTVTAALRQPPQ
jgi:peroxiredoxin